jgi:hypothetical protein
MQCKAAETAGSVSARAFRRRRLAGVCAIVCLTAACFLFPSSYGDRVDDQAVRCAGRVVAVDDSQVQQVGLIRKGSQLLTLQIEDGPFEGRQVQAVNQLLGRMDIDKVFRPGDRALLVLSLCWSGDFCLDFSLTREPVFSIIIIINYTS